MAPEAKPDFILLGNIDLGKSLESKEAADQGLSENRLIFGEITNPNKDEDDETFIAKSLDFSYFDTNGWIKYEHVLNDPTHIIGCPHERITTPEGGTLIKGALFDDTKYANAVWEMIKNIEVHNRKYPQYQKTLGWSIEGAYIDNKTAKGGPRKAKVVNVVVTPNPVNKTVYLQRLQENHKIFAKSLNYGGEVEKAMAATPTSTDVSQKTGVDAITKENIDEEVKVTAEEPLGAKGSKTKKKKLKKLRKTTNGSHEMKTFKDVEEATQHFKDQGMDDEDAATMAKSMLPEEEGTEGTQASGDEEIKAGDGGETQSLLKGIGDSLSEIKKAVFKTKDGGDAAADLGTADDLVTIGGEESEEEFIDAGPVLMGLQKDLGAVSELLDQKVAYDHQRDEVMAKALEAVGTIHEKMNTTVEELKKSLVITVGDKSIPLSAGVVALMKSRPGAVIDLENLKIAGEGSGEGTPGDTDSPVKDWAELQSKLEKGLSAGKITLNDKSQAETCFRNREHKVVKSIIDKIG